MAAAALLILGPNMGLHENAHTFEMYRSISSLLFQALVKATGSHPETLCSPSSAYVEELLCKRKPSLIVYAGCADGEGNWVLFDKRLKLARFQECLQGTACNVYSLSCFSQLWALKDRGLTIYGSSASYEPFTEGAGFLDSISLALSPQHQQWLEEAFLVEFRERSLRTLLQGLKLSLVQNTPYLGLQRLLANEYRINVTKKVRYQPLPFDLSRKIPYPRGFDSFKHFRSCLRVFLNTLLQIDPKATVVIQGSSVQGFRFESKEDKGLWFDDESDYDIALCSQILFKEAGDQDIRYFRPGDHTEPIEEKKPNLWKRWKSIERLFRVVGKSSWPEVRGVRREVNFMIYDSYSTAKRHTGVSLKVSTSGKRNITTEVTGQQLLFLV